VSPMKTPLNDVVPDADRKQMFGYPPLCLRREHVRLPACRGRDRKDRAKAACMSRVWIEFRSQPPLAQLLVVSVSSGVGVALISLLFALLIWVAT